VVWWLVVAVTAPVGMLLLIERRQHLQRRDRIRVTGHLDTRHPREPGDDGYQPPHGLWNGARGAP
jgi:hypothetical protein